MLVAEADLILVLVDRVVEVQHQQELLEPQIVEVVVVLMVQVDLVVPAS